MRERSSWAGAGAGYATPETMLLKLANRHGLVAGATGTGKTVTLQTLAESLSAAGVPVFLADVKGDLAGLAKAGSDQGKLHEPFLARAGQIGIDLTYAAYPVTFWDVWGQQGHPVRTTPAEMGPLLLSRLLDLTEAQEGVMAIAFRVADEEGLPLLVHGRLWPAVHDGSCMELCERLVWGLIPRQRGSYLGCECTKLHWH